MHLFARKNIRWLLAISTLAFLGCGPGAETFVPPPPPEVTISLPEKKEVTDSLEFTGNTKAVETVEIRARVQGFLDRINFEPGQSVKAGDLLFVIDPRPFQARVDQQKATVKAKEAAFELAKVKAEKAANLFRTASVSEITFLEEKANSDVALAQVGVSKADLEEAQLQLDYTQVKSPINGKVSRNMVDLGTLVGAQEKTLLTNVVNDSSIYAYFHLSESDFLKIARLYEQEVKTDGAHKPQYPCFLALADDQDFPHHGHIDFVDTQLDPATGTLQLRAVFPNKTELLLAGLFVRIRVPMSKREALLVPTIAVGMDQGGKYVLVVNKDNVVEQKPVTVGQQVGRFRVIEKGLAPDDWVIGNGMQRARPGAKAAPTKVPGATGQSIGSSPETASGTSGSSR
jgi:membrane fusion protein, multidrug efflux system